MKKISIAMATYNGERYLRDQLDSIFLQTIPFVELVIVDDASTDGTWDIISEYAAKDNRIKSYRNEKNVGVTKNFEKALAYCTGDYIALSDQDDLWFPNHLEALAEEIGNNYFIAGDAEIANADGIPQGVKLSYCESCDAVPKNDLKKAYAILFNKNSWYGSTMMIKKELLDKALPIPEINNLHDVWLSTLACFAGGGMKRSNRIIMYYRRHENSVTGNIYRDPRIKNMLRRLKPYHMLGYRPLLTAAIRSRLANSLTKKQIRVLNRADRYYRRRKTLLGRIRNLLFDILHFKSIYSC